MISELCSRVLAARDITHREHWACKSYAAHCAFGAFYSDVTDALDAVVENYQGLYGKIDTFEVKTHECSNIVKYLTDEADWIESHTDEISSGSPSIANLIQTLTSTYTKCIYLLGLK